MRSVKFDRESQVTAMERLLLDKAPDLFSLGIDAATIIALLKRPEIRTVTAPEDKAAYDRGWREGRYVASSESTAKLIDRLEEVIEEFRT